MARRLLMPLAAMLSLAGCVATGPGYYGPGPRPFYGPSYGYAAPPPARPWGWGAPAYAYRPPPPRHGWGGPPPGPRPGWGGGPPPQPSRPPSAPVVRAQRDGIGGMFGALQGRP